MMIIEYTDMYPAEKNDELLQCFDENGKPVEIRARSEVKQLPPRYRYAVARVWLINAECQIMCSQRGKGVSNGGKWQTYFGGHVGAGSTIKKTAQIELEEEAGIKRPLEDFYLIEKGYLPEKKVFFESYAVKFNGNVSDLILCPREVVDAKWMEMDDYRNEEEKRPDNWCGNCSSANQGVIREWLKRTN
jgi:8-oxo-dGTP pyrophosphatase MutT (NUDIX family)